MRFKQLLTLAPLPTESKASRKLGLISNVVELKIYEFGKRNVFAKLVKHDESLAIYIVFGAQLGV